MPDIALVIFEPDHGKTGLFAKCGFLKLYVGTALYRIFHRKQFTSSVQAYHGEIDMDILHIKLPFSVSLLPMLNVRYLEHYITRMTEAASCVKCFVPAGVNTFERFGDSIDDNSRALVFKALLIPMLHEIYTKSGIRLSDLEIAFESGSDTAELSAMVRQIEPCVKSVHVAASDKENVEDALSDICEDTGLSIFVSSDFKGIFRNAEVIVNLGDPEIVSKYRVKPACVVIDFSHKPGSRHQGEFTAILGVEYSFPVSFYHTFAEEVKNNYSRTKLTEIFMAYKAGLFIKERYYDSTVNEILKVFKDYRCCITGFIGRRGILAAEQLRRSVKE